jgi:hypothetical protein
VRIFCHLPSYTDFRIDWTSVRVSEIFMKIVCRASNRVFVGGPLCEHPSQHPNLFLTRANRQRPRFRSPQCSIHSRCCSGWGRTSSSTFFPSTVRYVWGFGIFTKRKAYPGFRLVNKLISNVRKRMQHGLKHLAPVFAARRKQHDDNEEKPVCLI